MALTKVSCSFGTGSDAAGVAKQGNLVSQEVSLHRHSWQSEASRLGREFVRCAPLVVDLLAYRDFAPGQADSVEDLLGEPKPLLHGGHDLDHLVDQIAVLVLDNFGNKDRADRLAILVELNLAVGGVEHERG